jgi:hypothetical protein
MFSIRSVQSGYKEEFNWESEVVVGGDEKESLESETVINGHKSHGTRTREILRWQRPAAHTKDRPRPLVREGASQEQDRNCHTSNKDLVVSPDGCYCPRQTGRLTVRRNTRLRLRLRMGSRVPEFQVSSYSRVELCKTGGWEDGAMSSVGSRAVKRKLYVCCNSARDQETESGECNRLRTLVCVTVKCKVWK